VKRKHKRLTFVALGLGLLAIAAALILTALEENVTFFRSPSDLAAGTPDLADRRIRLGGLVEDGSVETGAGASSEFTDAEYADAGATIVENAADLCG